MPEFHIPESRAKAAQRRKLSKVLAFVKRAQSIRLNTGCTIMPIPTTNKNMIAIAGSVANASNLIKFMCEIGLISIESDKYRFNSRRAGGNFSKKYRYYYENEVRLIEYCKQEGIKEHLTKNCQKKNEEALPAYLMISPENIAFSSRVRLVKPKNVSVAGFEENLTRCLYREYPDLERYQKLADEINETYYTEYPELAIRFVPHLTWDKTKMYIKKIGIRATNQCVSASDTTTHDDNLHRIAEKSYIKGLHYDPTKEIIITNGGMGALSLLFLVLLNEGDEILIQDPQWLNYVAQVKYCNGTAVRVPTDIAHNFEMQGETIENLISPRTKAIMINTPNNPTGCVMSEDSLYRIAEIAVKHDLLVISDDVYNTLIYDGAAAPLIAAFPHMRERTVIVNSFSKSFAMTGWRIGFVAGPAEIVDRMTKCQENFNACANSVGQYACAVALDHPELSDMICKHSRIGAVCF